MGHIAGARNVPLEELPARLAELQAHKARPIRILCRTDRRSAQAARLLDEAGFTDALVIQGGMTAWRAKGWPVE
jgi:rhodanese-related sulfurtransferase